ncbi:MAG: alpha/beta hydrolase [Ferruginibacter sp.]
MKKSIYLLPIIFLLSISIAFAQNTNSATTKPTIIFVHGLWADGSSFSKVMSSLIHDGYEVIAVQNPTTSIEDDVAATKRAIALAKGDVILVGHSWGGFVITESGDDPKVKALVYINAFAPDTNETIASLSSKAAETELSKYLVPSADGYVTINKEGVKKVFAGDLPATEQELVFAVQQPASTNVFKAVGNKASWKQKPSWFVIGSEDKTINPELQKIMANRAKSKTTILKASHVSMISKPNEVLKVIIEAANTITK